MGTSQSFLFPLLLFHPPILEPDFYLSLVQLQSSSDLHSPGSSEILAEVKLFLQLRQLFGGEIGPDRAGMDG